MKRLMIPMLAFAVMLGGCQFGKEKTESIDLPEMGEKETVQPEIKKPDIVLPSDIEEVVSRFVDAFKQKDYEKIATYYAEETVAATGKPREELITLLRENFEKQSIEVEGYTVTDFKDLDPKKYVEFRLNVTYEGEKKGQELQRWLLKKEGGAWKFDSTLELERITEHTEDAPAFDNQFLFKDVVITRTVHGYVLDATIENATKIKSFQFGKNNAKANALLRMKDGSKYQVELEELTQLTANHKGTVHMLFEEAEGDPISLQIDGVYEVSEAGEPKGKAGTMTVKIE